ncbi:MAG: hypothetical protein ACK47H_12765, partial [Akkermansiaceae bacterium]
MIFERGGKRGGGLHPPCLIQQPNPPMKPLSLFIALCLLTSCERKEPIPPPAGLKSPDLPTTLHSRVLEE